MSRGGTDELYHFIVFYDSNNPGVFTYTYLATGGDSAGTNGDGGKASVGMQGLAEGDEIGYSYEYQDPGFIVAGAVVVCDTLSGNAGSCVLQGSDVQPFSQIGG